MITFLDNTDKEELVNHVSELEERITKINPTASFVEPAENDIPKVFIDGVIPTTKDAVNAELTYISKTLSFHAYIEIKC